MATTHNRVGFLTSEEGLQIKERLGAMDKDTTYNTKSSYAANGDLYPNHKMTFVDKHMAYLSTHPAIDPEHYMSNLRLITRLR